ncbi:MAG: EAL domain-containing protein [Solobacterium sp.]|nr:EAL domain-containing protein [Solobacterium sp.]
MREAFSLLFLVLAGALAVCSFFAFRSPREIRHAVAFLLLALIPPVIGNMIIVYTGDETIAKAGYYIYFLGMDLVMFALLRFSFQYCAIEWKDKTFRDFVYGLLILDAVQYLLNPFFHQAFATEAMMVDGSVYYRLIPYLGQTFHRVLDYGIFFASILIFLVKMIRSPRIYSERYSVILIAMVVGGIWETYYIFSRTPIDRSMIGFAVFGLLVYYFALYYRPVRLLDSMLANIASQSPEALFFFDGNGTCIWTNDPGIKLAGVENNRFELAAGRLQEEFGDLDLNGGEWTEKKEISTGGTAKYYVLDRHILRDERGRMAGSFVSVRDNTEEQLLLQKERYYATHDMLTGLYTREHLYEEIQETLRAHPDERYYVVFVDVKDFKLVNDIFGNEFGDYVLCEIADLIRKEVPEGGIYGRLSGDMFGTCHPADQFDEERMEQILTGYTVRKGTLEHSVLIHLGVYEVLDRSLEISVMFDRARLALSTIKEEYQKHIAYYDDEMRKQVLWDQHISNQLPEAIAARQVRPYLQPIVNNDGAVVGAEALVRWIHPTDGFLSPAAFIPVFERNGMIAELDKYMWRCACEILAQWKEEGKDFFLSVNISPKDFYFMDVAEEIKKLVKEYDVDPSKLRIEITETVMMTDIENRMRTLADLKSAGFLVEMDDFGSGYSSLNMLKDMPVDVIKIDMVFLNESKDDSKAQTILHNVISMSDDLGISSLTEGVETQLQYRMLSDMGCRLFQGYYFAKPMPREDFEQFCLNSLQTHQPPSMMA